MPVQLQGVPETLLWTLYHRASEARRDDAVLHDPKAVELLDAIDFPFAERFGSAQAGLSQWQALRALTFDRQVERFLAKHPDGTVVALGEGLETQFWRVDNGRVRWLTVDLPEAIEVRERLLPPGERQRVLACSALDARWMRRPGQEARRSRHGAGPADVPRARRRPEGDQRPARGGSPAARSSSTPCRAGSASAAAPGNSPAPAAGTRRPGSGGSTQRRRARCARARTSRSCRRLRLPRGRGPMMGYAVPLLGRLPGLDRAFFSIMLARFQP